MRQNPENRIEFSRHDYYSIRSVETAWEFASDSSVEDVLYIGETMFRHCADDVEARLYRGRKLDARGEAARKQNSLRVLIPLARNVKLRVYAKTNKRIRFEVIQEDLEDVWGELRKEAGLPPMPRNRRGEMQERPHAELMSLFGAIRKRAAQHLNDFLRRVAISEGGGVRPKSGLELLAEIGSAVAPIDDEAKRARLTRRLMSIVAQQGGYRGKVNKGNLGAAITRLNKRGVFEYLKGKHLYAVAPAYGPAAASFRALSAETLTALFGEAVSDSRWDIRHREPP